MLADYEAAMYRMRSSYLSSRVVSTYNDPAFFSDNTHVSIVTALLGTVLIKFIDRPLYRPYHASS